MLFKYLHEKEKNNIENPELSKVQLSTNTQKKTELNAKITNHQLLNGKNAQQKMIKMQTKIEVSKKKIKWKKWKTKVRK